MGVAAEVKKQGVALHGTFGSQEHVGGCGFGTGR